MRLKQIGFIDDKIYTPGYCACKTRYSVISTITEIVPVVFMHD